MLKNGSRVIEWNTGFAWARPNRMRLRASRASRGVRDTASVAVDWKIAGTRGQRRARILSDRIGAVAAISVHDLDDGLP